MTSKAQYIWLHYVHYSQAQCNCVIKYSYSYEVLTILPSFFARLRFLSKCYSVIFQFFFCDENLFELLCATKFFFLLLLWIYFEIFSLLPVSSVFFVLSFFIFMRSAFVHCLRNVKRCEAAVASSPVLSATESTFPLQSIHCHLPSVTPRFPFLCDE